MLATQSESILYWESFGVFEPNLIKGLEIIGMSLQSGN